MSETTTTTTTQQAALEDLKNAKYSMPAWALAVIGILNALVTIVLALGIDLGALVDQKTKTDADIQQKRVEMSGRAEQTSLEALTAVLGKLADRPDSSEVLLQYLGSRQTSDKQIQQLQNELSQLKRQRRTSTSQ